MPDFSQLLRATSGEAKRPPVLPIGDYTGQVKSYEMIESRQNKTPGVRFHLLLNGWPANAPAEWEQQDQDGKTYKYSQSEIDLTKRQISRDFYITENALWRLDAFLRSCGVALGASYEEVIPQAVGAVVTVGVEQYINQNNGETGNQVGRLAGQAGE